MAEIKLNGWNCAVGSELDRLIMEHASRDGDPSALNSVELDSLAREVVGSNANRLRAFKAGIDDYVVSKSVCSSDKLANYRNLARININEWNKMKRVAWEKLDREERSALGSFDYGYGIFLSNMVYAAKNAVEFARLFAEIDAGSCQCVDPNGLKAEEIVPLLDQKNDKLSDAVNLYIELGGRDPNVFIPLIGINEKYGDRFKEFGGMVFELKERIFSPSVDRNEREKLVKLYKEMNGSIFDFRDSLENDSDINKRVIAFNVLAQWDKDKDAAFVEGYMRKNQPPELIVEACKIYRNTKDADPLKLVPLFSHEDPKVKEAAFAAYGEWKGAEVAHLLAFIGKEGNAFEAFFKLGGDTKLLIGLMHDPTVKYRAELISKYNDSAAYMSDLFIDKNEEIMREAINKYVKLDSCAAFMNNLLYLVDSDRTKTALEELRQSCR